jgi:membrane protease YdiL (CAAX protease family)
VSDRPPGATKGRLAGWLALVGTLAALNYASRFAIENAGTTDTDFFYRWDTFVAGLIQLAVMGGLVYWIVRGGPAGRLLALKRPRSWRGAAGVMVLIFIGVLVVGAALNPFLHPGEEQGLVPDRWHPDDAAQFGANLGLTTFAVPLVEELTFRGAGFSLLARYGRPVAIAGTAILFGAAHGLVLALPVLVAFGAGLAWLRSRSGSIYPGMIVHGAFNALAVIAGTFG